jgi:hypothetical protein
MKIRYFAIAVLVALQACSTAPTFEENSVQTVEATAAVACKPTIYSWTDENGTVSYGDSIPPNIANKLDRSHSARGDKPICVKPSRKDTLTEECRVVEQNLQNLQRRVADLEAALDAMADNEGLLEEIDEARWKAAQNIARQKVVLTRQKIALNNARQRVAQKIEQCQGIVNEWDSPNVRFWPIAAVEELKISIT